MNHRGASDLYLTVNSPAQLRIEENMEAVDDIVLVYEDIDAIINSILTARQRRSFENELELNTSLDMGAEGRYRVNILRQRQNPAIVIRRVISKIPTFTELRLPNILENLSMEKRGMILLTGITGSGKSTTLASMIDHRNENAQGHIITIEDPIEYFHDHKKSVITQREVGVDTSSFPAAMKNSLRQRPDVILVGEIRDREVMEQALTVAETGHLCLSTIHTNNTYQSIERIVNLFPEEMNYQVRLNLSMNLKAIVSQRLIPSINGGLVPAVEIMLNQGLVRELILKGEIRKIYEIMENNVSSGMCTFDQSLINLYRQKLISEDTCIMYSDRASDMKIKLQKLHMDANDIGLDSGLAHYDTSSISFRD
ncbi:MAG: PilT/PilU family type 4a pilus ATPase [Micavibrio sp.]|nr:PilT/PilU family type 4a pilus ATPase [Micavibrio sp.]